MWSVVRAQWTRVAAVGVLYLSTDYGVNRFRRWQRRTALQEEAAVYGDKPWPPDAALPRVTVVLDLRAGNNAARGIYNVEVAPLLHLAGLSVDVVEARERGQAKDIARNLETNGVQGIVVVGDDGTVQEFVTGWLRRDDKDVVSQQCPLGLIPLGRQNALDNMLHPPTRDSDEGDGVGLATMAVVRGNSKNIDTITIQSATTGQEVHALTYLGWGLPGLITTKTFNEYTRRSRWWAQFKMLKDVVLLGKTPEYKARLEYKRGNEWKDEGEVAFSALYATGVPTCRTYLVAPNQKPDNGLVTIARFGSLSPLQLVRAYWDIAHNKTDMLTAIRGVKDPTTEAKDDVSMVVADEFRLTPINSTEPPTVIAKTGNTEHEEEARVADSVSTPTEEDSESDVPLTIDGEVFESFPVVVRVNRQQLRVFL